MRADNLKEISPHAVQRSRSSLGRRKRNPLRHQRGARQHRIWPIDAEHGNGSAANRSQAHEPRFLPCKMFSPDVPPRVEQACHSAGLRVDSRKIGAFVAVAAEASQREVWQFGGAAVFLWDDVVHLETQFCEAFGKLAILSPEARASPDLRIAPGVHAVINDPSVSAKAAPWT